MADEYVLLMPFLDESESFANGFSMGRLWEKMSNKEVIVDQVIQADNEDQVGLMCNYYGYQWNISAIEETGHLNLNASPIDISNAF